MLFSNLYSRCAKILSRIKCEEEMNTLYVPVPCITRQRCRAVDISSIDLKRFSIFFSSPFAITAAKSTDICLSAGAFSLMFGAGLDISEILTDASMGVELSKGSSPHTRWKREAASDQISAGKDADFGSIKTSGAAYDGVLLYKWLKTVSAVRSKSYPIHT